MAAEEVADDYIKLHGQLKKSIQDEIMILSDHQYSDNKQEVEELHAQVIRDHGINIKKYQQQRQLLEKELMDNGTDNSIPIIEEINKLWLEMEQELNNFKKATEDQCAKIQLLEDNAVKICGKDYEDLHTKMDILAKEYKKFVSKISDEEFDIIATEHQQLNSKVEILNEVVRDLEKRVDELGKEYYNTNTVRNRIIPSVNQHKTVTDFSGIFGCCVTELMWCLKKQNIECTRSYHYPEITPELLQSNVNEFETEITQHEGIIIHLIDQCKNYDTINFAPDVIEVVRRALENMLMITKMCFDALKVHCEHYSQYFEVHKKIEGYNSDYEKIISQMDRYWKDSSLPHEEKLDIMKTCHKKMQELIGMINQLEQDCQNVYPYDLRPGPLGNVNYKVILLCECHQLHLSFNAEYLLIEMKGTKWKIQGAHDDIQFVHSTFLQISSTSPLLMTEINRVKSLLENDLIIVISRVEDAEQNLQVYTDLSELVPWLQLLVNQLPQQRMVAGTMEQLQAQRDWLKVCENDIIQREPKISQVLNIQEKLHFSPDINEMMEQFINMWKNFQIEKTQWSEILEATLRCLDSTMKAEISLKSRELWILREGKPPRNQNVLQYIQEIKEEISKCDTVVEQMKDHCKQYGQLVGEDYDELKRRVDIVNDHWGWLQRIVNKFDNQFKRIREQTQEFDHKYQEYLTWSSMMTECVNTKLSAELEQLKEHKQELDVKLKDISNREDEVDDIVSSSRLFATSLQLISEEYDEYSEKLAKCSSPIVVEESDIEQIVSVRSYDPSASKEDSIVGQAIAVKERWEWIVKSLKQKLDQCNNLIKELHTFEEQYCSDLVFIEQGESLINEHTNALCESYHCSIDDRISKCQEFQRNIFDQQKKHDAVLKQGRKLYQLNSIDEDNDIEDRVYNIIDKWNELCKIFRSWKEDLEEEQEDTKEQKEMLDKFSDTLGNAISDNPFNQHCKLKPEGVKSEVEELQHQFLNKVWDPMEELMPVVDDLKTKCDKLSKEEVDGVIQKFYCYYQLITQQKSEVEQIKFLADGYTKHLELVSKCITETDGILVASDPLATQPHLVEKQLNTIEDIERQLKDNLALKEKLINDNSFIASMKNTVNPELLDASTQDISQTWEAIQDQVTKRKQKGEAACAKLKECCCIMKQLEKWLKEAEEKYRKMSVVAKSKEKLEKQLCDVEELFNEVNSHSDNMKSSVDTKDEFVEQAKEYEEFLWKYLNLSNDLKDRFGHVASIIYSRNTERKPPSTSKLGSNPLKEDTEKLAQNYYKLLANLEKKLTKLQEIRDKHLEVMKASDIAKERLKSIQHRKDKLTESTSWSQPTVMKEQIDIYSELEKECISAEQDEIRQLQKAFNLLEQAREDIPKDYSTTLASEVSEIDEAHQLKCSSADKLTDLKFELNQTGSKLNRAYKKISDMNQAILYFERWLNNVEQKAKHACPKQVTDKEFNETIKQCIDITGEVGSHRTQYDTTIELIDSYLNEFDITDVKDQRDTLNGRWEQLQEELAKKQQDYENVIEKLKSFNDTVVQYEEWLREKKDEVTSLTPLAWGIEYLMGQKDNAEKLLEELRNKHKEIYEEDICSIAAELTTHYKQLNHEYLNKKTNEEFKNHAELVKLLNKRLSDIESKKEAVTSLLADQESTMGSLKHIDEHIDAILVATLSSSHIDQLLKELQALQDQFNSSKQKVGKVVRKYEIILTAPHKILSHDETDLPLSPLTPNCTGTSVDYTESSVDTIPGDHTNAQGEGFKELQENVKLLEEVCTKVEDKLREKTMTLTDRKTAIEEYYKEFHNFQRTLECAANELNFQFMLDDGDDVDDHDDKGYDDYTVKEQLKRIKQLIDDIQKMEPTLNQLCEDASLLSKGTIPDEEPTKLLNSTLTTEKKKHQNTLESAKNISDILKSENDMIQKASELLLLLKPWMIEQQRVLNSMKPAALLSYPLSDQITKSEKLTDEIESKEKDFEELNRLLGQLQGKHAKHTIHKTVRDVTEEYQNINNTVKQRSHMLLQFKRRVCEYERQVEDFAQWLTDCHKRIDEIPVDISNDELSSQPKDIQEISSQVATKESLYDTITKECNQLCNDPTDGMGCSVESTLITEDFHPSADAAKHHMAELDQRMKELKEKLRDKENKVTEQQGRMKKLQNAIHEVGQWLDEKEKQLECLRLLEVESTMLQEKIVAVQVIQEDQTNHKSLLDNLETLLADVVSDSSADNPFKQQLVQDKESLKERWQQLTNAMKNKQKNFTDALELAEKYEEAKGKVEKWMMETNVELDKIGTLLLDPKQIEQNMNKIKAMESKYGEVEAICTECCEAANSLATKTNDPLALNAAVQRLQEEWKVLKVQLTDANNEVGNALDKVNNLNRQLKDMSDWLSETLLMLDNFKPCAAQVHVIDDEISKAKTIMEKVNLQAEVIQIIQNLGQDVISQCGPHDKTNIQLKLDQITSDYATVKDKVKQVVEYLDVEKVKAEDYEKLLSDLDDWLKDIRNVVEQMEGFVIDSIVLKQQVEKIKKVTDEANMKLNELNRSEEQLLGAELDLIVQYERAFESTLDETLESSVDKPLIPDFAKRQGVQEAVNRGRKLRKRFNDFKCNLENQLPKLQDFLLQVQDYEASLGVVDEWLKKEKEIINSVELSTCTSEKTDSDLVMIKEYKNKLKSKDTDLKNLKDHLADLTTATETVKNKEKAEDKLLEAITLQDDLSKSLDSKENQLTRRKQRLDNYTIAHEQFLERLSNIQKVMQASLDFNLENIMTEELKANDENIQKLITEMQEMESAMERLSEDASLLLEGATPDEKSAISIKGALAEVKKRYQDTLESLTTTRGESDKLQEINKLLQQLEPWLTEQVCKLNSMKPAAVLSILLSDQITENEKLSKEIISKEKDFEELKVISGQLGARCANHTIHKKVKTLTEEYQNIDNNIKQRCQMLSQFKIRVCEYERKIKNFTQWLTDCHKRIDELPVVDISLDGLLSQHNDIKKLDGEITINEADCVTIKQDCDQLCNNPTDSIGNDIELSLITADYHPMADAARHQVTQLEQTVDELKRKLKEREKELKEQQERVKRLQEGVNETSEWLDDKEQHFNNFNLSEVEPMKIQKKITAIKMMQEEQSSKQLALDDLESLLTHVVSGSSAADNPFKQQLERDSENLKRRWQQLADALKGKEEDLTDALQLAEKHEEHKAKFEQWMMESNVMLQKVSSPSSNPKAVEEEYSKIKAIEDEYEELRSTYAMWYEAANSLATKIFDSAVAEAFNVSLHQLMEEWEQLKHQLNETDNKLQNALDKASDLDRCHKELSGWLTSMLDKLKHMDPCATQVNLINDQISEANAIVREINSRADSLQAVQTVGQEVMSWCNPNDTDDIELKLNEATSVFTNIERMAQLHLEELNKKKVKAEDCEKLVYDLDNWLKDKETIMQQWEDLAIDSDTLQQQIDQIEKFKGEVHDSYHLLSTLNESENELLGPDYSTKSVLQEVESVVNQSETPCFVNGQGAQEVVDENKKLHQRYEDLKCNTENQLVKAQELLCQVRDYEKALSNFDEWFRKEKETVKLIKSIAYTSEDINDELTKIQEVKNATEQKRKDLEDLYMTGKALMGDHKIEGSRKEAEQQFSGINNQWEELLKLIDEKKLSLLAKQKEIEDYMNLSNEFSSWMDGVEKKLNEPLTLTGDPHNITNQLHKMKELAQQITDHKSELDNMVHHGKVAEHPGPAGEADLKPTKPHSHYSFAMKRYKAVEVSCQRCVSQLEETLNEISKVTESIEQLISVLKGYQGEISKTSQLRVKSVDIKEQLQHAQELDDRIIQQQPDIDEKQATAQLYTSSEVSAEEEAEIDKTDNPLNKSIKQLVELSSTVNEMSASKLKELKDRLEKANKFEQDINDTTEWFKNQQDELINTGSVRGVPDRIKEQLAHHKEFRERVSGKKEEFIRLKILADELKDGAPELDENILIQKLAELDDTIATLIKGCTKHQQELEEGLKRSNKFNDKLQKAITNANENKRKLDKISPAAKLDIPSVKAKLDELKDFKMSLTKLSTQVSEVNDLGDQLKDSCSDKDGEELNMQLKVLSTLWNELNSCVQQRIQHQKDILSLRGQFSDFMTWIKEVEIEASPPGVEPLEVKHKMTNLEKLNEEISSHHQPVLVTLSKSLNELMTDTSDPSDVNYDELCHYMKDAERCWNSLDKDMKKRREQLQEALQRAVEFRGEFEKEMLWLNSADDQLSAEWKPHGLSEKCEVEIEQFKKSSSEICSHSEPIGNLLPLAETLKLQGSEAEGSIVDGWLKELQDGFSKLNRALTVRESQLQIALEKAKHFQCSYQILDQWVDSASKAQDDPIMSELNAVQNHLETHKATVKEVAEKEEELNEVIALGQLLNDECVEEDGEVMLQWLKELQAKWDNLNIQLIQRKTQMEEALLKMGQFQHALDELWVWLCSIYEQLSNPDAITGKIDAVATLITKNSAIQRQLGAKQLTYTAVMKTSKQLVSQKSEDDETLQKKLDDLEQKWNEVCKLSADRQQKLDRVYRELEQFNKHIGPLQRWLVELYNRLCGPVDGDSTTVEKLVESQQHLQNKLAIQKIEIEAAKHSGGILSNDLLDNPEVVDTSLELMNHKWDEVCEALENRQNRLEKALLEAKSFEASYDDALEWVKIQSDYLATHQLAPKEMDKEVLQQQNEEQKKFATELLAKHPDIYKVLQKGNEIVESAHSDAVPMLQKMIQALQGGWEKLNIMASDSNKKLSAALLELRIQGVEESLTELSEKLVSIQLQARSEINLTLKDIEALGLEGIDAQLVKHQSIKNDMVMQQSKLEALKEVRSRKRSYNISDEMASKIKNLYEEWEKLSRTISANHQRLSVERKELILKHKFKEEAFDYEKWRRRFIDSFGQQKERLKELFIKFDTNHDRKLNREEFIKALQFSNFPMSIAEIELVADNFFPNKRNAMYLVTVSAIVDQLMNLEQTKVVAIEKEIQRQISQCTCPSQFQVKQIKERTYQFGSNPRQHLLEIQDSTVVVRVGGGWTKLTEFLQKHDPCRAKTMKDPIIKNRKSDRRISKESRQTEMKEREQEVVEDTICQSPVASTQSKHTRFTLPKKLDHEQLTSPPRPIPTLHS